MTDSLQPSPSNPPPRLRPAFPATSLSALVSSELPTIPAQPEDPTPVKKAVKAASLGRYVAIGVVFSGLLVGAVALRDAAREVAPAQVRLGSATVKHTQKGVDVRWRQGQTKVYLDASLDQLGDDAKSAIKEAFSVWSSADAALPQVEFARSHKAVLSAKPDGKNTVLVAPITVKGHEHDLAITLTYSDEESGDIVEADIIINSEYAFRILKSSNDSASHDALSQGGDGEQTTTNGSGQQPTVSSARASCTATAQRASCEGNAYDLQNVATHEVGHFFGLGEDMNDSAATMYYCTSRCETHKRVLTVSDTEVMASLYTASPGASSEPQGGCGGARVAPRGRLAEAGWAVLLGLLGLVRKRRSAPHSAR